MSHAQEAASSTPKVNSVLHATQILEYLTKDQQGGVSVSEISKALSIHQTTVYRLLRTLQSVKWVEQSASTGRYRLGTAFLTVSDFAASNHTGRDIIVEEMRELAERFNETVVLAAVRGETGICLELIKSKHNLSFQNAVGYSTPFHAGATGRMLLASQPDDKVAHILKSYPEHQAMEMKQKIDRMREQGYWISESEVDIGAAAVSVPVKTRDDTYVLSISGPAERLRLLGYDVLRQALQAAADSIHQKEQALR